jgi:hypothetical protein
MRSASRGGRSRSRRGLIVLQPLALNELPEPVRQKARVVYQSVTPNELAGPAGPFSRKEHDHFEACIMAHMREVKDPLRPAYAARLVPKESKLRIVHLGGAMTPQMQHDAEAEVAENPRFMWLGSLPRDVALARLAQSDVAINSSLREGGANAVGEAIAAGVPVIASRIPGNVGLLGDDYPGYYEVGDSEGLAEVLWKAESSPSFLTELRERCNERRTLFSPELEDQAWGEILSETVIALDGAKETIDNLAQMIGAALGNSDRRRHPRFPIKQTVEMEFWSRGDASNERLIVPVSLKDVSPEGISAELMASTELETKDFVAVSMRLADQMITLPGRLAWTHKPNGKMNIGVQFQLVAADDNVRQKYVDWIYGLLRQPEL